MMRRLAWHTAANGPGLASSRLPKSANQGAQHSAVGKINVAMLHAERVNTTLPRKATYELSPCDGVVGPFTWISRVLFFKTQLQWNRLRPALDDIERVYPPLCGRFAATEDGSRRYIVVDPDGENGFGVVQVNTSQTLSALRANPRMICCSESNGLSVNWPAFLELRVEDSVVSDQGSLLGVHLVHAADGCVLSFSMRHILCDGTHMVQLLADLGRAYRKVEMAEKHLDRSLMWPDQYIPLFNAQDHSLDTYPRCFVTRDYPEPTTPVRVAQIHLPQATIERMKKRACLQLEDVDFLSTHDLLVALCWLLRAESSATEHPVAPGALPIQDAMTHFPVSVLTTGVPVIPKNYFGNALARALVTYPSGKYPEANHTETLARAASLVRQAVNGVQNDPVATLEGLRAYYDFGCTTKTFEAEKWIASTASQAKMPTKEIDFGHPFYACMPLSYPCSDPTSGGGESGPNGDGVLLYLVVTEAGTAVLQSSTVLEECAPGAKIFPEDLSEDDASTILGL